MKTENFSIGKIKDILNRDEMKQIMAGCGSGGSGACAYCYTPYNGKMNCSSTDRGCFCPISAPDANYC